MGSDIKQAGLPFPILRFVPSVGNIQYNIPIVTDNVTGVYIALGKPNFTGVFRNVFAGVATVNIFTDPTIPAIGFINTLVVCSNVDAEIVISADGTNLFWLFLKANTPFIYSSGYRPFEFFTASGTLDLENRTALPLTITVTFEVTMMQFS